MQASSFAVKGNLGFDLPNQRLLPGFGDLRKRSSLLHMTERGSCFGLRLNSASMGVELGRVRISVESVFRSSAKARSIKAQAAEGDIEGVPLTKIQGKSSASVLPYVGIACLGAILFG